MKKVFILLCLLIFSNLNADSIYYYYNNERVYLSPYYNLSRSSSNIDYYQNEKGLIIGVTNKIIVKLKSNKLIGNLLSKYNVSLVNNLGNNIYLLEGLDKNLTIDVANQLNEDEATEYAQPDFIKKRFSR